MTPPLNVVRLVDGIIPADECPQTIRETANELARANASLLRRENLLQASASASRMLLEAEDVMSAMPEVLRIIGQAAGVDRICLMRLEAGTDGKSWLVVKSEWVAEGVTPHLGHPQMGAYDLGAYPRECSELQAGRSVCIYKEQITAALEDECNCQMEGAGTKSKAIVPIFIDDTFVGILGFDNTRQRRAVDASELAALETTAGVIGAALHREKLGDAMRHERERAAEERVTALTERNRVAQEIHDGLAQAFTGILMQLGAAEELESVVRHPTLSDVLKRVREIAKDGLAEARRSVLTMRPEQTRRGGLALALRQLADRSTVSNRVSCRYEGDEADTGLPPEYEHELLRIAQEAVSNALRHARPQNVCISMMDEGTHWMLCVTDDGRGMEAHPEYHSQQGFGLSNMRERAGVIGGEWRIVSRRNEGTRISVRLPKKAVAA